MEREAERRIDLQDGGEFRVPFAARRLVERLPGRPGFLGGSRHAASDHAQRVGDLAGVAIREGVVEPGERRFGAVQASGRIERPSLDGRAAAAPSSKLD
jgi:hypothetical protein